MPRPASYSVEASHTGGLCRIPAETGFALYLTMGSLGILTTYLGLGILGLKDSSGRAAWYPEFSGLPAADSV
jgi:hypothetical protein